MCNIRNLNERKLKKNKKYPSAQITKRRLKSCHLSTQYEMRKAEKALHMYNIGIN